jgi:hypothetical protein
MATVVSALTREDTHRLMKHLENLKRDGLRYLRMENFIHKATDGPDNVFSSVYSQSEAAGLFSAFRNLSFSKHYLNERHFPVIRNVLPARMKRWIETRYGWHLWIKGVK